MSRPGNGPPEWAERALTRSLPAGTWRDSILGDLHEEHAALRRRRGPLFGAAWYAAQAFRLAVRYRARAPLGGRWEKRRLMSDWLRSDLRQAVRGIRARPALSALVVATLAIGLASNAAVFTIVDALVLRPLPFRDVDRLVMFAEVEPGSFFSTQDVAPASYVEWRQGLEALESPVALAWWGASVRGSEVPEAVQGFRVTPGFFSLLGVQPQLGRALLPEEGRPGAPRVGVLGHALWSRSYGADPDVVGREIFVDGEPLTVVGVAPPGFDFPVGSEIWSPLSLTAEEAARRDATWLTVIGRLRDGASLGELEAQLAVFDARARREHPREVGRRQAEVRTLSHGMRDPGAGPFLVLWQVSALLVLLIACANVANLTLARGAERYRELAVRQALGAGRGRLLRQMLTESVLLALAAALLSLPIAGLAASRLRESIPASIARWVAGWDRLGMDAPTVAFTFGLALLATAVFGAIPALAVSRPQLANALKDGGRSASEGRGRQRGRSALVVAEIAVSLALLIASGLAARAAAAMIEGPQGYQPDGVLAMEIDLPESRYPEPDQQRSFARRAIDRLVALPGVRAAAVSNTLPSTGNDSSRKVEVEGRVPGPEEDRSAHWRIVTPDYLAVLRQPLEAGRAFTTADDAGSEKVALVSRSLAERYWPGQDPLGRRLRVEGGPWLRVVGVTGDVIHHWYDRAATATVYQPLEQQPIRGLAIAVRVESADPESLADQARAALAAVDPERPVYAIRSLRRALLDMTFGLRIAAIAMATFALVALLLAASGVYGVMAYRVSQRTQEIGVRVALGARTRDVLSLTLGQAGRLTAIGLGLGLALAVALARGMVVVFHGALNPEPHVFAGFAALLGVIALVAGYVPARRALRVDPVRALRSE